MPYVVDNMWGPDGYQTLGTETLSIVNLLVNGTAPPVSVSPGQVTITYSAQNNSTGILSAYGYIQDSLGTQYGSWTAQIAVGGSHPSSTTLNLSSSFTGTVYVGHITADTYTFSAATTTGGTVTGTADGSYTEGTAIHEVAAATTGYTFSGWTTTGITLTNPALATQDFSMPAAAVTMTAHFTAIPSCTSYTTQATCTAAGCYWWNGSCHATAPTCTDFTTQTECQSYGCYWYNSSCHATPQACTAYTTQATCNAAGCYWWNGSCHATAPTCTDFTTQTECQSYGCYWYNSACHATPQTTYAFSAATTTGGTVTGTADGSYTEGTAIHEVAAATTGYTFSGWTTTGITLTNPALATQDFSMPAAAVTMTANFTQITTYAFTAYANPSAGGSITGTANGNYAQGAIISVTANVGSGYAFQQWYASGITLTTPTAATQTFNMPANAVTLIAIFQLIIINYPLSLTINPTLGGTIIGTAANNYPQGTTITETTSANPGYIFSGWTATGITLINPTSLTQSFLMPGNAVSLTANFTQITTYNFTAIENPAAGGTITGTGDGNYAQGTSISVGVTVNTGYTFTGWTATGITLTNPSSTTQTFSMPANAVTLQANFTSTPLIYAFLATENPAAGGAIQGTPNSNYAQGTSITVVAVTNTNYTFSGWTAIGITLTTPTNTAQTFDMPANAVTLVANFTPKGIDEYSFAVMATTGGQVTGTASGSYAANTNISVTAMADDGYKFTGWTGTYPSTNMTLTFNMPTSSVIIQANFTKIQIWEQPWFIPVAVVGSIGVVGIALFAGSRRSTNVTTYRRKR